MYGFVIEGMKKGSMAFGGLTVQLLGDMGSEW